MFRYRVTAGALAAAALAFAATQPASAQLSCSASSVRCVGAGQEYGTIQSAVNVANPGDTVLVHDGNHQGFQVSRSGTSSAPIVVMAAGSGANITSWTSTRDGIFLSNVDYVTIQGFRIANPPQRCISARNASPTDPMRGLTIRGNLCTNAGHEGMYLSEVSHSLIEGNTVTGTGADGQNRGHGIYLANAGSDNTTLRGNRISGAMRPESSGIHFNGDESVGGDGVQTGLLVEDNVIFGNHQNGLNMDGVQSSTVQNNLIYGNGRSGVRGYRIDGAAGPRNMRVINNTMIASSGGWGVKFSEDLGGHVIFNNILLNNGSAGGAISVGHSNVTSDYNVVVNRFSNNNESSVISLSTWRGGGDDTHSVVSTPAALFVDPGANDYRRRDDGPAADAGEAVFASVSAPDTDLEGVARPAGGAYDIGAYETSNGAPAPTPSAPAPPRNVRIIR